MPISYEEEHNSEPGSPIIQGFQAFGMLNFILVWY